MAKWIKDAHKVKFVKIYYRFHPDHGKEVRVFRSHRDNVIIQTIEGKKIGIPKWMIEKEVCLRVKESSTPYCSHDSLRELRKLLSELKA